MKVPAHIQFICNLQSSFKAAAMLAVLIVLAPLAQAQSGNVYTYPQLRGGVDNTTVVQTRPVMVSTPNWQERAVGTAVGGALGAAIGNAVSHKSRNSATRVLVTGLAAAAGGYTGNRVTQHLSQRDAQEIIVQAPNGRMYAVVQPSPAPHINPGDNVRVLQQGGQTRVIRAANWQQEQAPTANWGSAPMYESPQQVVRYESPFPRQMQYEHKLYGDN